MSTDSARSPEPGPAAAGDDSPYAELRAVAIEVSLAAAAYIASRASEFGPTEAGADSGEPARHTQVRLKSSRTDPVTAVDTASERLIRERLAQLRPDDGFLGEEGGQSASRSGVVWIADPIDGTVNFLYDLPGYAVSLAAVIDGEVVAGAVVDVVRGRLFHAALGGGAILRDEHGVDHTLAASTVDEVALARVGTGFGYSATRRAGQGEIVARVLPRVRDIRRIGSAAIDLCLVAAGQLDAYYEHGLNPWDWTAAALIAAEAGAITAMAPITAFGAAGELSYACAPGIGEEFAALLRSAGAEPPIPG